VLLKFVVSYIETIIFVHILYAEEKQPMKTDKVFGILSLILGLVLAFGFLKGLKGNIKDIIVIIESFTGRTESYNAGRPIGHLIASALFCYGAYRLFKYSFKVLTENKETNQ
jgi:hypothetical protein